MAGETSSPGSGARPATAGYASWTVEPHPGDLSWAGGGTFTATTQVAFGANGIYAYATESASVACTDAAFGDPDYGVVKACFVAT